MNIDTTPIPGLLVIHLDVHADNRGWFKEAWQREKMVELGLPDFRPVQNNMSFNLVAGTTRGIHAEPWDKLVTSAHGRFFGVWVDLRDGPGFGTVFTTEFDHKTAIFVPYGVANAYQTLTVGASYSYLVNDHWTPEKIPDYSYVNLADPSLAIDWPIPLTDAEISDKDRHHPNLDQAKRLPGAKRTLILGGNGQLGIALGALYPDAHRIDILDLNLTDPDQVAAFPWRDFDPIINAAAWTNVDGAETPSGRRGAWKANATMPTTLARIALAGGQRLVHISSDYVFDGWESSWSETADFAPLSVYGASKAAGDLVVSLVPRHYLVRTSWVVGEGRNFISTMADLADRGLSPQVVCDQIGRLTHTANLAAAIKHLLDTNAPYGTYNCTDGGEPISWVDVAKAVFVKQGRSAGDVTPVATEQYYAGKENIAPRPAHSVLDLTKLEATGYVIPTYPLGE
ncbi:MAG: bifunctional dTDP-4-dehydrorhamnose 3,5-epimerase family protein/NAD(P)-dependent oxidoreductase [Propionibacteriaceae bacterium]|jgi:dTDP-4-dehydrorhamnose 3,5-epimerase|nr:bifunctional dTDP-4-dehydrorhamnose 3,5-epimerase family protein/NAD(P)-dependent oxidoreductase [Propionibacteriaceae bacterium]